MIFFWETKFDEVLEKYPKGFSDALFPNIGYTYLINLGTPFIMQTGDEASHMRTHGFLPRHKAIECFHRKGNRIFGIKFRISPVIFLKKINFSEYNNYIFPLSYLLDNTVIEELKKDISFKERIGILNNYFRAIVDKGGHSRRPVETVKKVLEDCDRTNRFDRTVEEIALEYEVSVRTLQRYFETVVGINTKTALQIMRIRKATAHLASSPADFHYTIYGYYDHSHFYRHLRQFVSKSTITSIQPHLELLKKLHLKNETLQK